MRIFLVIIDGFGVGEMPDAKQFGDEGSNTFKNLSNKLMLNIPNLTSMGLCNIDGLDMAKNVEIVGAYGKMQEVSLA
ncbi:MAG: phosphopentomutase, partial [Clostridia bacterium]